MFPKRVHLPLFISALFLTITLHSSSLYLSSSANATTKLDSANKVLVAKKSKSTSRKKTGGRSGGGSFKNKKSSGSRSKKKSRNTTRKTNTTPSRSNRRTTRDYDYYEDNNTYYERRERRSTYSPPTYRRNTASSNVHPAVSIAIMIFMLLVIFLIIFIPLFIAFKAISKHWSKENRTERKIHREISNDIVTVSLVQVALSSQAEGIQTALSELSLNADTESLKGVQNLMREAALTVMRHPDAWRYVRSHSESIDISQAETTFDKLSFQERSKYSSESLSNVEGVVKTKEVATSSEELADYVVVTLLFGTVDDKPLFDKVTSEQELDTVLLRLAAMNEDHLLKFELLWSPQEEGIYLSDEELLLQYTDMIPLV